MAQKSEPLLSLQNRKLLGPLACAALSYKGCCFPDSGLGLGVQASGNVMVYVSILHAPEDEAFAQRVAAGLSRRGCEACPVSGDALEGDLAVEDAPAVVLWTPRSISLPSILRHARGAMARGALVPIKTLGVVLADEFASLAPADLTGWMGDDNDPRWRFVAEEVALITARTRLQDGEVWASAETDEPELSPSADEASYGALVADNPDTEDVEAEQTGVAAIWRESGADSAPSPTAASAMRRAGFNPRHVLYAASAALLGLTVLAALTAPMFFTGGNNTQPRAAQPETQPGPASLATLTVDTPPSEIASTNQAPETNGGELSAEPGLKSPPPLRDVEPIAIAAALQPELEEIGPPDQEQILTSAPRLKPAAERIVSAAVLDAEESLTEEVVTPVEDGGVVGDYLRDCVACPDLAIVPSGRFVMGSPSTEPARHDSEGPVSLVDIVDGFAMAAREITIEQWDACVAGGGCSAYSPPAHGWGRGKQPVVSVSFEDAQSYVAWLSQEAGRAYRLPSEAEWEYAARAGSTGPFSFGGRLTAEDANYNAAYTYGGPVAESAARAVETGSFSPNVFGLYDMHGNVWEWTADCWADSHQDTDVNGAPRGAENGGDCALRVLKGGAWNTGGWRLRSAHRIGKPANVREYDNGFRIVRDLD